MNMNEKTYNTLSLLKLVMKFLRRNDTHGSKTNPSQMSTTGTLYMPIRSTNIMWNLGDQF